MKSVKACCKELQLSITIGNTRITTHHEGKHWRIDGVSREIEPKRSTAVSTHNSVNTDYGHIGRNI
jgi:hypothetical protein